MSEPTGDGNQKPEPDQRPEPDQGRGENQDQSSESTFSDPTAPVWADPTAPIPAPPSTEAQSAWVQDSPEVLSVPPAPPGATYSYGQQPAAAQATPPDTPPVSNPYAQQSPVQTPVQPYGQPAAQPYGQPTGAYGQPQPGQPYPTYGQSPYATGSHTEANTSAIILTILSALSLCNFLTVGSLVIGIIALSKNSTDPEGSRRLTKIGWIVFAVVWALVIVVGVVGALFFALAPATVGTSTFGSGV